MIDKKRRKRERERERKKKKKRDLSNLICPTQLTEQFSVARKKVSEL